MPHDYIPRNDADFRAWARQFVDYVAGHEVELGLAAAVATQLQAERTAFEGALTEHVAAHQAAKAARQAKDRQRRDFERTLRQLARQLQASPAVDDGERAALGLTVPDPARTPGSEVIRTRPVGAVDTSQRLRHKLRIVDEATPTRRAKPKAILGCEIWVKVAAASEAPPAGPEGLRFVGLATRSVYLVEHDAADGGQTAHYLLRWVRRNGVHGPWSETLSATITR